MNLSYRIHIGNSIFLPEVEKESVDLVFTSPPYTPGLKDYGESKDDVSNAYDMQDFFNRIEFTFISCEEVLKPGGFFIVNCANVRRSDSVLGSEAFNMWRMLNKFPSLDFDTELAWIKPTFMEGQINPISSYPHPGYYHPEPRFEYVWVFRKQGEVWRDKDTDIPKSVWDKNRSNVWNICPMRSEGKRQAHPATFPIQLPELVIQFYSPQGGVVLDPWGGTGTTMEAAFSHQRSCILFELYPKYLLNIVGPAEGMKLLEKRMDEVPHDIYLHRNHLYKHKIKGKVPYGISSLENVISWNLTIGDSEPTKTVSEV